MVKIEVTLSNIMEYIGDRSRPLIEGEAVFKAGHIILCGLDSINSSDVRSLCLQTSGMVSKPHEITISLDQYIIYGLDENLTNWKCVCSCKAGASGFCKHIIGTLIYINRHEDLDLVSITDLEQKWGKEKKGVQETYKAKPFKEFCHPVTKKKKLVLDVSEDLNTENFAFLSAGVGDSALSKFLGRSLTENTSTPRVTPSNLEKLIEFIKSSTFLNELKGIVEIPWNVLQPCCKDILNSLHSSNILETAMYDQGSKMWMKERQLRITGSTCYSIFTFSKNDEWENKAKKFFFPKSFTNKNVQHGKLYEEEARKTFKNNCGDAEEVIQCGLIVSGTFPWIGYSPDGVVYYNGIPTTLLEIKCPFIGKTSPPEAFLDACDYLETLDGAITLKKRHAYYGQIQLGMAILNLTTTKLILYSSFSKTYLEISVPFDAAFGKNLIQEISRKYFTHMLHVYCLNKD